jgi:lipoate-protein ligase A
MAIDRALPGLAAREGAVFVRLYAWSPHCLSFGRHEPAARRYDRDRLEAEGIDCVRRPTGGRAVWHARELTYAVAAPAAALGGLRPAYHRIHEWLATAITHLGAPAHLAMPDPSPPRPGDGACFAVPVGGEVLVEGWKVVGSAQVRLQDALLQHGSMLLADDQSLVRAMAREADLRPAAERPLAALLGRPISWHEAADAVITAAHTVFDSVRSDDLAHQIAPLAAPWEAQFRDPRWTWER